MVCLNTAAGFRGIDVKGVKMRTYLLQRVEFLTARLALEMQNSDMHKTRDTCANAAPVSRTLLLVERGSPRAPLVT